MKVYLFIKIFLNFLYKLKKEHFIFIHDKKGRKKNNDINSSFLMLENNNKKENQDLNNLHRSASPLKSKTKFRHNLYFPPFSYAELYEHILYYIYLYDKYSCLYCILCLRAYIFYNSEETYNLCFFKILK